MNYRKITSLSNPRVKETVSIRDSGERRGLNAFLIEGPHIIEAAIDAGAAIEDVFFSESFGSKRDGQGLLRRLSKAGCEILEVTPHILDKIAETGTPQGIIAVVTYNPRSLDSLPLEGVPLVTVVDGIQDPGNLGTIIRTSDAAGADAVVILPGTCSVFMPKTVRATAGSIFNIPVVRADTAGLIEWTKDQKIRLAATSADGPMTVFEADLNVPIAFVFGTEAHGVSQPLRMAADMTLKIPICGKAESLNVAASAAICLYETMRQRGHMRQEINPAV